MKNETLESVIRDRQKLYMEAKKVDRDYVVSASEIEKLILKYEEKVIDIDRHNDE